MALLSTDQAKTYLRILTADFDGELALKVPQANSIVLNYVTVAEVDLAGDDLAVATAAAGEVVRNLFEGTDPLSPDVKNMLRRLRDPSLA